jgi:hypothetical protein
MLFFLALVLVLNMFSSPVIHLLSKCVQPCSLVFFLLELFLWMIYPSYFAIFYYILPPSHEECNFSYFQTD